MKYLDLTLIIDLESVLRDLLQPLRRRTTEIKNLEKIFNTHAHEDVGTHLRCGWQDRFSDLFYLC
jgi:hypothetical protein